MVATRRGAKTASEAAPANTLNAPPKRGGRKKTVVEETAQAAPAVSTTTKTTAAKRKAKAEPEAAEPPLAKKPTATSRATRAAKVDPQTEPVPAAVVKRATRGRKPEEATVVEEPVVIEDAPKPAPTRTRKAPAKKTSTQKNEGSIVAEKPAIEEAPKPAPRARKAPARKAQIPETVEVPVLEESIAAEPHKPAARGRKAAAPKLPPSAPVVASRATRGRNIAASSQDSPLKAPARKPARKAAAVMEGKNETEPVEDPFVQYPAYPTTPAHIVAPLTARQAMKELPQYPNTPAHIRAPISMKDAMAVLPGYPKTPAHINAPITSKAALAALPGYPNTPAHIKAPISVKDAMAEMPGYPKTPAHIVGVSAMPTKDEDMLAELPDYPNTPAHIVAPIANKSALNELPDYPKTPAHIVAPMANKNALNELPGYPKTPAHIQPPLSSRKALAELPDYPTTPAHIAIPTSGAEASIETPADNVSTPEQTTPPAMGSLSEVPGAVQTPMQITWGVTNQEAFAELPEYPKTPGHITAPVTTKQAFDELPEYPKTPAHIIAPVSTREALAELPSYPTTPAMALEAAIQAEISASVKKQTPSPLHFPGLDDVSFQFAETSEYSEIDAMEWDSEAPAAELTPKLQFAPLQLTADRPLLEVASPKKSALRSPQKTDAKTPKKAVTWDDPEESELFMYDGPLQGMTFIVDVTSNGKDQNFLFAGLLEDLGAKVIKEWTSTAPSHVLYKDGSTSTLEKVLASKGAVKCVNVGWVLDSEKNKMRMDETPYLVDLSIAMPTSPLPSTTLKPFTPARTPSKYALPPSSECKSAPTTPTSSEFDRSFNFDDKENCEHGVYFDCLDEKQVRTVPQKKSSFLFSRSPIKTPSKPGFLINTPVKPMSVMKPFSTTKKRSLESSFPGISIGPPKKLRLF